MGKPVVLPPATLRHFSRVVASDTLHRLPNTSQVKPPISKVRRSNPSSQPAANTRPESKPQHHWPELRVANVNMEGNNSNPNSSAEEPVRRIPLAEVVSDCIKRWFQDTLKEAKAGDTAMQVLVSQMYYSGYGVSRDAQKGKAWMNRASRTRSSVWKVSDKRPGYNASDSDSDDDKAEAE